MNKINHATLQAQNDVYEMVNEAKATVKEYINTQNPTKLKRSGQSMGKHVATTKGTTNEWHIHPR